MEQLKQIILKSDNDKEKRMARQKMIATSKLAELIDLMKEKRVAKLTIPDGVEIVMFEPDIREDWLENGYIKRISVKQLKELLNQIPEDNWIYTKTLAQTGNLPIATVDAIQIGYIDIGAETSEYFEADDE